MFVRSVIDVFYGSTGSTRGGGGGEEEFWGFEKHCVLNFLKIPGFKKIGGCGEVEGKGEGGGYSHSRRRRLEKIINVPSKSYRYLF